MRVLKCDDKQGMPETAANFRSDSTVLQSMQGELAVGK